jgi:hypothetical protein
MLRPNAPRMVTVLLAIGLFGVGLIGVLPPLEQYIAPVNDLLASVPILVDLGLTFDREFAHWLLVAGPTLLIVGSLLPGI